jgi:RNA polymerase sigma factor for flagellar operon FliA
MPLPVATQEKELWHRWIGEREQVARDALIQLHAPWARLVARDVYVKVRIRDSEWGDYVQNATVGLIESIDRYEPTRGVDFRTFARHRVRGAVFNGLRHLTSDSFSPSDHHHLERSTSLADNDADPLQAFVTWTVGLGIGHLLEAASLPDDRGHSSNPYAAAVRDELTETLKDAIAQLPMREQMVLTLHYFQHVPFVDIAAQMQLTKGRISQIHRQAIESLRVRMQAFALAEA